MKKIYFAGKFDLTGQGTSLAERLLHDYRSRLLGDSRRLTAAKEGLLLQNHAIEYHGCFYCEKASEGDYTSTDCDVVVREETRQVLEADVFCCVLDLDFSVGSVVELMDALHHGKRVAIFYRNKSTRYQISSEYWFAITRALHLAQEKNIKIEVFAYEDDPVEVLDGWLSRIEAE